MVDKELTIIDFAAVTGNQAMLREDTLPLGTKKGNDDHLSVKHLLPKTKISHTILHDNTSQDRLLASKKQILDRRANRERLLVDRTKKSFMSTQVRKRGKWKREDDVRINCLNLPSIHIDNTVVRPPSMKVLYSSPDYNSGDPQQQIHVPLKRVMGIRREKTEIISHHEKIAVTKLPSEVRLSTATLRKYDRYRGTKYMSRNLLATDKRFVQCEDLLSRLKVITPPPIITLTDSAPQSSIRKQNGRGFYFPSPAQVSSLPLQMRGMPPFLTRSNPHCNHDDTTLEKNHTTL